MARVSDVGGEVSQLLRKAGFYASGAQVHALTRGPASWEPGELLSCVWLEAYVRLLLCVDFTLPWYFTLLYFTFFILLNCPSDLKLTLKAQGAAHDQTPY